MINIAVLGYGTVGSGVVEVINTNHESINKRAGDEINIKYVLDLRDFPGDPVEKVLVHDYEVIVNDPEVDIVVEVMGGIEPAYTFVKRALQAGKSVSTSNKALVAKHGSELMEIAKEKNINFKWFIIGYGGDEQLIHDKIKESGMEDEVIILGKKANPYPYIKKCDIYIQPSRYEGKAVTVLEAQMLGKPVVITDFPSSDSQLEDGIDGVIVPLDDSGCADGIVEVIQDRELRIKLVENCQKRDYSSKDEVEKLYKLMGD